ncbi:hypothetical protein GW17_00056628 [Ensete ventricosum]|nr:hypothetical protein GW17_00056628 [Ensete ventricosum]
MIRLIVIWFLKLMKKTPSRKVSHGSGVETEKSKTVEAEEHHGAGESRPDSSGLWTSALAIVLLLLTGLCAMDNGAGGPGWAEKSPLSAHVAIEGEAVGLPRATAPTPDGARWRRVGARRPTSRRLDPSGVVIVFATL